MTRPCLACAALATRPLAGCASLAPPVSAPTPDTITPAPRPDAVFREAWVSASRPEEDIDSLAVRPTETGDARLIATAKASDQLVVYDAGARSAVLAMGRAGSNGPAASRCGATWPSWSNATTTGRRCCSRPLRRGTGRLRDPFSMD